MKKLFQAIRKHDFETVKELIEAKPELVNCVAKQPPKSDDGQSPLQVALKTGGLTISEYLLDHGADVNFMESKDCCNAWRAPVIHDAINAAVMCSRYNTRDYDSGKYIVENDKKLAERALHILERMIAMGADVNAADSYGNTCLWRFCLQASQILPSYDYQNKVSEEEVKLTRTEYAILKCLMQNNTQAVAKSRLLDLICLDTPDCTESSLKIHVSNLRKKLRDAGGKDYIEAVWGIGFRLQS